MLDTTNKIKEGVQRAARGKPSSIEDVQQKQGRDRNDGCGDVADHRNWLKFAPTSENETPADRCKGSCSEKRNRFNCLIHAV